MRFISEKSEDGENDRDHHGRCDLGKLLELIKKRRFWRRHGVGFLRMRGGLGVGHVGLPEVWTF